MISPVDQIKDRLSIVDVVSSYIKLEKAGINYKARCPFHNEKTPSFFISPGRGSFHCFGCGKGGDIFSFVEEMEGVDFSGALKLLASRAGVELVSYSKKETSENEILYRILDEAALFYENNLTETFKAREYLAKRGVKEETMKSFRIGYAPPGWRNLHAHLLKSRFQEPDIEKTGLIIKSAKGYYDRFRERIMFPICDRGGRVIGFSGRAYPPTDDPKIAKYINSPETILYNKSLVLFGYDKAKQEMLRKKRAVIVEGQMDLIMAHQAGTGEAMAVSGTALTDQHLSLIHRFADTLILCFDADNAGLSAVSRSAERAIRAGFDVKVAELPNGLDPADLILKNKDAWNGALDSASHVINFFLEVLKKRNLDERELRREVSKIVLPYVAHMTDRIDQAHFISLIAKTIKLPENVIAEEVEKQKLSGAPPDTYRLAAGDPALKRSKREVIEEEIAGIFLAARSVESEPFAEEVEKLKEITGNDIEKIISRIPESRHGTLALQAELIVTEPKRMKETLAELINNLHKEILTEKYNEMRARLEKSELEGRHDEALALLKECSILLEQLRVLQ